MPSVNDIATHLDQLAPLAGAEDWDNVGLLVGDRSHNVRKLMTCLTLTPTTVAEAIDEGSELVVVHHPLPFRPLSRLTTDTSVGRLLWQLIRAGVSVYSAHTAFDSACEGINQQWADGLGLADVTPLVELETGKQADGGLVFGAGRIGNLAPAIYLHELAERVKTFLSLQSVSVVGDDNHPVKRVAIACGSGGSLFSAAIAKGCDCFITGETNFHTCLEAEANLVSLVLCGHYASERFAMERLAEVLAKSFLDVKVWASRNERNPLREL